MIICLTTQIRKRDSNVQGEVSPASVGPVDIVVGPPAGPADTPPSHVASRPKVLLTLPTHLRDMIRFFRKFKFDAPKDKINIVR